MPELTYDWISGSWPIWKKHLPANLDSVLEIGCFEGRSTLWLLANYPDAHITCIDTFEGGPDHKELGLDFSDIERRFRANTAEHAERVMLHKGTSLDWLRSFNLALRFNVIIVDGSHMAADVLADTVLAWTHLASGGILILDDYGWGSGRPPHHTPKPAIDAFLACHLGSYDLLHSGYQVLLRKL